MKPNAARPEPRERVWLRRALPALAVAALVAAVFLPVLRNGFIAMDDPQYVTKNPNVQNGLTFASIAWAFTTAHADNWHPLTWLSHTLDWSLFGPAPWGHHLTSLLLHAASAGLLFALLRRMTGAGIESALVALAFGVHPLRVESVAWVAERKDVLSTAFGMLAMLAYASYARRPSTARYLAVAGALAAGLLCKPMLVTLPIVFLLLDLWPLGRREAGAVRLAVEKIPLLALSVASTAATFWAQSVGGAVASFERVPPAARIGNALVSYVAYLGDTFWPSGLALYYPHPGASLPWWQPAAAALVIAGITVTAAALRRRAPYLLVGWLWYLVTLVPVIGFVQIGWQARADRYTYLPQIGILVAIVWGLREAAPAALRRAGNGVLGEIRWGHVPVLAALPALTAATWIQLGTWKDSRTLAERSLSVTRDNATISWMLGNVAAAEGKPDEAIARFREALRIQPRFPEVHLGLADLLAGRGDFGGALEHVDATLHLWPDDRAGLTFRGRLLSRMGRQAEALSHFAAWARREPGVAEAHAEFGAALGRSGRHAEAVAELERAVELRPGFGEAHSNLAAALLETGRIEPARTQLRLAVDAGFTPPEALTRRLEPIASR